MALCKLFLEDEQVVVVVEDSIEEWLQEVRLHTLAHLLQRGAVYFLHLACVQGRQHLRLALGEALVDLVDLRELGK